MQDITGATARDAETAAFAASVRTFQAAVRGLERANVNYVPYYSKGHISKILKHYYDQISIYKNELDRMEDKSTSQQELVKVITQTMSPWRPLLGLLSWCPIFESSHRHLFEDREPVNEI